MIGKNVIESQLSVDTRSLSNSVRAFGTLLADEIQEHEERLLILVNGMRWLGKFRRKKVPKVMKVVVEHLPLLAIHKKVRQNIKVVCQLLQSEGLREGMVFQLLYEIDQVRVNLFNDGHTFRAEKDLLADVWISTIGPVVMAKSIIL